VISVDLANPTQPGLEGLAAQYWMEGERLWGVWVVASTCGHRIVTEVLFGSAIRLTQNLEEGERM